MICSYNIIHTTPPLFIVWWHTLVTSSYQLEKRGLIILYYDMLKYDRDWAHIIAAYNTSREFQN